MPQTVSHRVTKLRNYSSSSDLFISLPAPILVQKQPGYFAPALAHEVRNPLTNINLAVEMLQSLNNSEEEKLYFDIILRASARINGLLNDLLLYHQAAAIKPERSMVTQLIDEVLAGAEDRIMMKNIKIIRYYRNTDCCILADRAKIKIAFINIIINAIDAMPPENGQLKILVRSVNGKCVIQIEDNGIGISKVNLQNIFKPYFSKKTSGMGLGLSTTLETLLSNQARVAVQSEEGRGTRFILSFNNLQPNKQVYEKNVLEMA